MIIKIYQLLEIFPYKIVKLLPLRLSKYFKRYKDIKELDLHQKIVFDENLKITLLPAALVKKRIIRPTETCGEILIEYKNKNFICLRYGVGDIYKELGEK